MSIISKAWWRQAVKRWKCTTPKFFKKMKPAIITLVSVAIAGEGTIQGLEQAGLDVPNWLSYLCTGIALFGAGMGVTARLPTNDPEIMQMDPDAHPKPQLNPPKPWESC